MREDLEGPLQKHFGHAQFRTQQKEIIQAVLSRHDCFAILPTGGGKSICYQLPGLLIPGTTLVISPLQSLMKDQVLSLHRKGISAAFINSTQSVYCQKKILIHSLKGRYKFLYVTPEKLTQLEFQQSCQQMRIPVIAIDEAHCISEWGVNFRPSYRKINTFIELLTPRPTIIALTATATKKVEQDVINNLHLKNQLIFRTSFKRTNLILSVVPCKSMQEQLIQILAAVKSNSRSAIIYTATREKTGIWARYINYLCSDHVASAYHGQLPAEQKNQVQEDFFNRKIRVVIATSAFGMGIDKSDISQVLHLDPALTLEEYYQEVGRAGRDGQTAHCTMLLNPTSFVVLNDLIKKDAHTYRYSFRKLLPMINFTTTTSCRMKYIMDYFGEKSTPCEMCDNCTGKTYAPNHLVQAVAELKKELSSKTKQKKFDYFLTPSQIVLLALLKPQSPSQFLKIPGIGRGWLDQWYSTVKPNLLSNPG